MVDRRVVPEDDMSKIGLRIKAARVLTSFNQEEFAEKFGFGYASVKNWELGRSIPRNDTFTKIVSSLADSGVQVSKDWLLYGSGSGPTHGAISYEPTSSMPADMKQEIAEFEKWCNQNEYKSLITIVSDEMMAPFYFKGDYLGAIEIGINKYQNYSTAIAKEIEAPFLVEIEAGNYQPRFLRYDSYGSFKWIQTQFGNFISDVNFNNLGKIMWVRRNF